MNEHTSPEAPREYGELYYSADAVAAILQVVAGLVEGNKRIDVLRLSHDIPTTMRWPHDSQDSEQPSSQHALSRPIQLWLCDDALLGTDPLRLTCLLRRGPSTMRSTDWQHFTRLPSQS